MRPTDRGTRRVGTPQPPRREDTAMSLWSVDLSKWGAIIRERWGLIASLCRHGGAFVGPAHIAINSVGLPTVSGSRVSFVVSVTVSVDNDTLSELVQCHAVQINRYLSAKLPVVAWPEVGMSGESIAVAWPVGSRPIINAPGPDPLVSRVVISPDGSGTIEIQGGPDGTITY